LQAVPGLDMKLDISIFARRLVVMSTTIYTLKFRSIGVHSVSCDLLKFLEITANITETVYTF